MYCKKTRIVGYGYTGQGYILHSTDLIPHVPRYILQWKYMTGKFFLENIYSPVISFDVSCVTHSMLLTELEHMPKAETEYSINYA